MFTLVTIATDTGPAVAIHENGRYVPLASAGARLGINLPNVRLFDLLQTWDDSWPLIAKVAEATRGKDEFLVRGTVKELPPWGHARKVVCGGANYYQHLVEMGVTFEKTPGKAPFFFLKPPNALVGPGRTVPVDPTITMLDWEVEMTAIIGRGGRDIPVEKALEHVAGYTVSVDVTARDRLFTPETIFKFDFLAGKGQDGFCPTHDAMLPARFVPDPQNLRLRLALNGTTKQDASTSDMIYGVAELVHWASKLTSLDPGDVLLTGSPEGVGFPKKEFMKAGDTMRVELEHLGGFDVELFDKPSRS
jgi:2-keto-4-pentenoate hydratase/2-oxohepta-3-ene-1,7-dioic acid hydratase in catechol pathway